MSKLKTAVIGVGYLGKFHADKYAAHENCDLPPLFLIDQSIHPTHIHHFIIM